MEELRVAAEELQQQNEELVEARDELEKERKKYLDLFDFAPDGYLITDHQGMILEANKAAGALFNVPAHYLVRKPLSLYIGKEHRKNFRIQLNQFGRSDNTTGNRIENWEFRIKPRNGDPVDVSATVIAIRPDSHSPEDTSVFRWLIRDTSLQKRFEEEIKEIKHELMKSRERSRQQLARGLHDGPVQDLHGVIFQLKPLEDDIDHPRLKNSIDSIETQLVDIIRKLRLICSDLRPPVLIPFGLEKAIQSHARTFQETNTEIQLDLELAHDNLPIPEEMRLVLFQIYRQAMANVQRHAEAQKVCVRLLKDDANIFLEIEDDGKGFLVPKHWIELIRHQHYGLADAAERAESIGGKLVVKSTPGQGTKVSVILPPDRARQRERLDAAG
jgi:signal transduction histidine kinase